MKEITNLTVTQIRVFPVDVLPLSQITTKSCIERIRSDLSVGEIEPGPFVGVIGPILFLRGEIKEGDKIIVINRLTIEPRRILLEVAGTSKEANQVYNVLLSSLDSAIGIDSGKLQSPLITSETTQCSATLDFPFWLIFNNSLIEFLNNEVKKKATGKIAKASVSPLLAEVEINYEIMDKTILDNKITMSPKKLTIAARTGTTLEARKYFISSPFDSDTHLKLVRDLEKAITKTNLA